MTFLGLVASDLQAKSRWCYQSDDAGSIARVLLTDGTPAMILYRLMQASRRLRLSPLEMLFGRLNSLLCNCVIGRGAEFGPRFVLIHATGVVINGQVTGGAGVHLEHQVTIGAERRASPRLGDDVFVGAGAKILGPVRVGTGARVGANAVVTKDVPAHATVVGVPAQVVRQRGPEAPA
jgi:serine O-acetyltransferase